MRLRESDVKLLPVLRKRDGWSGIPVRFTDIRPGFVATAILDPNKQYPMMMSLEKAADEVIKAIRRKKRIYTFDWKFRILVFFWRLVPRCLWERLTWVKN